MTRVGFRWLPAVMAPVLIAVGVMAATAATDVTAPAKTPEQVLTLVSQTQVRAFSGTVEQTSQLGLPELPTGELSVGAASALELLTGAHTARVYIDGPTRARIQVMDTLAERDLVRNGDSVWLYNSREKTATHVTVPAHGASIDEGAPTTVTPAELAQRLLAELDPSTEVTLGPNTTVAGRTAYDLVLTPRTSESLVDFVSIAVDAQSGLPLSVGVHARGQEDPAIRFAFTSLALQTPSAELFDFTPPAGTSVTEQPTPSRPDSDAEHPKPGHAISGSGWSTVVELPAKAIPPELLASPLFASATTAVDGGRLLSTSLVNILLTDDGRAFAGAVPLEALQAAVAGS